MKYSVAQAIEILDRTPSVCTALLSGLSEGWVMNNEGPETFFSF